MDVVAAMRAGGEVSLADVRAVLAMLNLTPIELPFPRDAGAAMGAGSGKGGGTLYLTGDTHGENIERFSFRKHKWLRELTADDVVVVLGDTGLMWPGYKKEAAHFPHSIEDKPFQIIFLLGNHDNYDWAETLPEVEAFGGVLRQVVADDRAWPGRYVCKDWAVLDLAGKHCLLCAHADSHDAWSLYDADDHEGIKLAKKRRERFRIRHVSWWPQEKLDVEAFEEFIHRHKGEHFDAILTHDRPAVMQERLPRHGEPARPVTDQEKFFDRLREELDFGVWAHGHMHYERLAYYDEAGVRLFCLYGEFTSIDELEEIAARSNG